MNDEDWMRMAIEETRRGIATGQSPFGACIVRGSELIVAAHNLVIQDTDSTAHGEVTAIRQACARLKTIDLAGCAIYSTCEPCPMCFSAIHWANLDRIVYGACIADADSAGFREMPISNLEMKRLGRCRLEVRGGVLREASAALFAEWLATPGHRAY